MPALSKQASSRKRNLPTLRKRLKQPETYLGVILALLATAALDSCKSPSKQTSVRVWSTCVLTYQRAGRPLLDGLVVCRYKPSCSDYSIEAVQFHGISRGLFLTIKRVTSCTKDVPLGTSDPVQKPAIRVRQRQTRQEW